MERAAGIRHGLEMSYNPFRNYYYWGLKFNDSRSVGRRISGLVFVSFENFRAFGFFGGWGCYHHRVGVQCLRWR